jgi:citrate synthase
VIVPALAATDRLRLHLDRPAVVAAGMSLIAGMTDALAVHHDGPTSDETQLEPLDAGDCLAARLAGRLCSAPITAALVRMLNAALVLLADYELAASTFAARVAASVRADPYAVIATGLGAMAGALHDCAALGAEIMLASAASPADAARVVGELLRRGEMLPGFGHVVYKSEDPRASLLLRLVADYAPRSRELAVATSVIEQARHRSLPAPNVDFSLAVLARVVGMALGSGEAIFAIGRTAGWLGHALEEYERSAPARPRGTYTGRRTAVLEL